MARGRRPSTLAVELFCETRACSCRPYRDLQITGQVIYAYVCIHTHTIYIYVCIRTHTHARIRARTQTHTHTHASLTPTHPRTHTRTHTHIFTNMRKYMLICLHTYLLIYILRFRPVLRVKYVFTYSCGRSYKNRNSVFRLVKPVYGMDTYMFKVNIITKQAKLESITHISSG